MRYILNKFFQAFITVVIVSAIVFIAVHATGDPVGALLPSQYTEEQKIQLTKQLGLDQPYIVQYGKFISQAVTGDLGESYSSKRPVFDMIFEKIPYTLQLAVTAIIVALIVTIIFGSLAALKKGTFIDGMITNLAAFFKATPTFFLAIVLVQILGVKLRLLPVSGAGTALHLVLPAGILGLAISSDMVILLRGNMIEELEKDYIKFARLKGISEYKVVLKHALRNSFTAVLALSSFIFSHLIAGSVVMENVFAWPGIGNLTYTSVIARDFPVVQGIVLVLSVMTIILSFIIDIITAALDPRIRKKDTV